MAALGACPAAPCIVDLDEVGESRVIFSPDDAEVIEIPFFGKGIVTGLIEQFRQARREDTLPLPEDFFSSEERTFRVRVASVVARQRALYLSERMDKHLGAEARRVEGESIVPPVLPYRGVYRTSTLPRPSPLRSRLAG